jgi:hypothetical protein
MYRKNESVLPENIFETVSILIIFYFTIIKSNLCSQFEILHLFLFNFINKKNQILQKIYFKKKNIF